MQLPPLRVCVVCTVSRAAWRFASRVLAQTTKARALFQGRFRSLCETAATRKALRSQSAARVRVQTVVRVTSPLNARHPPSHWLAGIGTLPLGQVAEVSSGRNPRPLLMWSGYARVRTGAYSSPGGRRGQRVSYCDV